nr:hypothetical protein [Desulfobacterales bacterium]
MEGRNICPVWKELEGRGLCCYWAVRKPGYELTAIARSLGISVSGGGIRVIRGGQVAKDNDHRPEK